MNCKTISRSRGGNVEVPLPTIIRTSSPHSATASPAVRLALQKFAFTNRALSVSISRDRAKEDFGTDGVRGVANVER